jgi:hypothetical protein
VVLGFDPWQYVEFLHIVPHANLAPYMHWIDARDWSCNPPTTLVSSPNAKPHCSSLTFFVCSISFNISVAILHNGECVMSLNLRMHLNTFPSDVCGQETGWKDRHCTAQVSNTQLTATLVNFVYTIKIHNNLGSQINHFTVIGPHTARKQTQITGVALCHKKAGDTCVQLQWYSCFTVRTHLMIHKELDSGRQYT